MSISRTRSLAAVAAASLLIVTSVSAQAAGRKALNCAFVKQRVAIRTASALLACQRTALAAQTPVDPACTDAAFATLHESFATIEAQGGCMPAGDADFVEEAIARAVRLLGRQLQGSCSAAGETCSNEDPPCCTGLGCGGRIGEPATCG